MTGTGRITLDCVSFSYRADRAAGADEVFGVVETDTTTPVEPGRGVSDITLSCPPGSLTVLCGPSGSGKSTVLRLINGLAPNFHPGDISGTVRVSGADMPTTPLSEVGGLSATVFQNPRTQFFTSTVTTELAFTPENFGVAPPEIRARVTEAAERCGISGLLGRKLSTLSGGQLQRVACTCAVVAGVPVLLLDEATSNLSPTAVDELATLLAELKSEGTTIITAEHRLHHLRDLADTVHYLRDGRIERSFTGREFFTLDDDTRRRLGLRSLTRPVAPVPTADPGAPADTDGLELRDIRFSYGARTVLDIPHMVFPAGTVTGLTGPNGAGKTTLARLICGLGNPAGGGRISLAGRPLSARDRAANGYIVMQDTGRQLFADTVIGEVTLGTDGDHHGGDHAAELLAALGLADTATRHPLSLSGGQRQRLVIATALAQNKRIYVFDEPTSGVDLAHLDAIAAKLRELAEGGAVVIVISHDAELISACCDRVIELTPHLTENESEE
ncbi:ABC transporter ATP-binding protein [Corynebacterium pygosceleis]|uniref:ABC transporter ATP-binding protein n=1 Tax=Corynebacterium pygosceleis TaxID=2800406 RepID=UPI0020068E7E|nr:ABC transporter ATP-binding protein [Corynebacterium pygosceleis]MCK7675817.1 ABC transporter ATP-binding protein [Corynebacterium pygosceleis]